MNWSYYLYYELQMAKLGSTIHSNETILNWLVKIIFSKIGIVSRTEVISLLEELGEAASLGAKLVYTSAVLQSVCLQERNNTTWGNERNEKHRPALSCPIIRSPYGAARQSRAIFGTIRRFQMVSSVNLVLEHKTTRIPFLGTFT